MFTGVALGHYVIRARSREWELKEPVKLTIEISSNPDIELKMQVREKRGK